MASFPSVRIEGGLLGPDLLDELLAGNLPGQRPADFGLDGRRNFTAELAAAFADARAYWGAFGHRLERLQEDDPATTPTRDAWAVPLLGLLGYELQLNRRAHEVDGLTFAISHRAGETDEAPPVHIVGARQELGRLPPSGRPRLAPHSLVQEYLNRTEQVWGLVTNGLVLRLLRNSSFVRRQAYVEFDLRQMLEEQHFADFAVLYRLMHRTRLPRGADGADECLLDRYYAHSREQGDRVREYLREGVEECIQRLANGFLRHPANEELRRRVATDTPENECITADDLYRQLLRLVYRLLFLLVSEDRGLLSPDHIYREHYGVARLRRLLDQRAAFTGHDDIWQSLRVLWRVLSDDKLAELLRLAPLNGELFVPQELDRFTLSNRDVLEAFWFLAWYQEKATPPRRVNYAALDVEELGSVYESLLDFHPVIDADGAGRPVFALIEGSERKSTGSYYTPPELVTELIKSALDPVITDRLSAAQAGEREGALLSMRVCDPACGSGHFLLAAARRIGKVLAQERTGEAEPAPERVREAIRDVIAHCIYGVDKNPLAVDLCRVALWLESHTGDKPLTFLDHRIRCGDSLVGAFDLEMLKKSIPDEAFKPLEGHDREAARKLARRNSREREGQRDLFARESDATLADFTRASRAIDQIGDDTPEAIRRKKELFEQSHADPAWRRQYEACDLWTAAFFQPLRPEAPGITSGTLTDHLAGRSSARLIAMAWDISLAHQFFHWPLEFPDVLAQEGFSVVVGNPPWGSKLALSSSDVKYLSSRFGRPGKNMNVFALFIDLCLNFLLSENGRLGILIPKNFIKTDSYVNYRRDMLTKHSLHRVIDFGQFPNVAQEAVGLVASAAHGMSSEIARFVYPDSTILPSLRIKGILEDPRAIISLANAPDLSELVNVVRSNSIPLGSECVVLRGLEHGRSGRLAYCSSCSNYFEWPGKRRAGLRQVSCPRCHEIVVLDQDPHTFISQIDEGSRWRGLLVGTSIDRYRLREVPYYARLGVPGIDYKELDQRNEKLLFIRISKSLRGYLDRDALLCLNALNIVRKRSDSRYDLRYILSIMNSKLLEVYAQYAVTAGASLTIRFSNSVMRTLPIPRLDMSIKKNRRYHDRLVNLCERTLGLHSQFRGDSRAGDEQERRREICLVEAEIDEIVYCLFGVSDEQRQLIRDLPNG